MWRLAIRSVGLSYRPNAPHRPRFYFSSLLSGNLALAAL